MQPLLVAVFGASQPSDDLYDASVLAGAAIARAGFGIINGGYHGTMEGSALGHKLSRWELGHGIS